MERGKSRFPFSPIPKLEVLFPGKKAMRCSRGGRRVTYSFRGNSCFREGVRPFMLRGNPMSSQKTSLRSGIRGGRTPSRKGKPFLTSRPPRQPIEAEVPQRGGCRQDRKFVLGNKKQERDQQPQLGVFEEEKLLSIRGGVYLTSKRIKGSKFFPSVLEKSGDG